MTGAERLGYYATRFDTVEVNTTFYRLPFEGMIKGWNARLPETFHLVLKGPRSVTHLKRLTDCDEALARFLPRVAPLRTLRVILWQLPPSLRREIPRLDAFLATLPASLPAATPGALPGAGTARAPATRPPAMRPLRHAVEFRHASWWDAETTAVLARHRAAFVAVSHPDLPPDVVPTADLLYLRLHGVGKRLYDHDYSAAELRDWAARVRPHLAGRVLYAFFNNDWHANAPRNAEAFREILGREVAG